ncbi:MAG: divalent metal cation transporter, partial [Acidobacteriota bacterium]|nr:divalent metal cation transporter [Acidobacteriota bacterium]
MSRRWAAVVLNAVIVAAFIGPGTVTAAASAGSKFGSTLLWAMTFSVVACFVLQEMSARITILSGRELGTCFRSDLAVADGLRRVLVVLVLAAVVIGCTAYQAGNLLGAVAGIGTVFPLNASWMTGVVVVLAGLLLALGSPRRIAAGLTALVAIMGLAFVGLAISADPGVGKLLKDGLIPTVPPGSETLILALLGTTVVPYNLFLGSGVARGRDLADTRWGIAIAVGLGGVISMSVMVAASGLEGPFSFSVLGDLFGDRWGAA